MVSNSARTGGITDAPYERTGNAQHETVHVASGAAPRDGAGPLQQPLYGHADIAKRLAQTRPAALLQTRTSHFASHGAGPCAAVTTDCVRYPHDILAEGNALIAGENLAVMKRLHARHGACLDLIYVDPPFLSDAHYHHRGMAQGTSFSDQWPGGHKSFVPWLVERILLMHALLKPSGSIYVHLDWHSVHYIKVEMDKIFGHDAFQREIIWRMGWVSGFKTRAANWIRNHDTILFYTKSPKAFVFNKEYIPYEADYVRRDGKKPTGRGIAIEDTWNCSEADRMDTIQIKSFDKEKSGYNTQKNETLLGRIIRASSPPGGVVADFFCGSGTTCVVAQKLGRRWIGVDTNPQAIAVATHRVHHIAEQRHKHLGERIPDFAVATGAGFAQYTASGHTDDAIACLDDDRTGSELSAYVHFALDSVLGDAPCKGDAAVHGVRSEGGRSIATLVAPNQPAVCVAEVTAMLASARTNGVAYDRYEIIARGFTPALLRRQEALASAAGASVALLLMRGELPPDAAATPGSDPC